MPILINETMRVIIQGITGREGSTRAKLMADYGTNIVAGVTPGRKGEEVHGIPVFDSVQEAVEQRGSIDVTVIFVPAPLVKNAAMEAFEAGVKLAVLVPDRVPLYDAMEIAAFAKVKGARFIGPNTLGLISPDRGVLGMIGGRAQAAKEWFRPGNIGVISRSGGMASAISYYLCRAGLGLSTIVHVGGDAVIGMREADVLQEFQGDPETKAVVLFGEIGTSQEEEVAELIRAGRYTKPLIAYIGGRAAKSGTRFSHAGAIIEGGFGTYAGKVEALKHAGAHLVEAFGDIPGVTGEVIRTL
ncbi:MAG: succinate--CoA ligase subunit alpha [Bacillota bacterium]